MSEFRSFTRSSYANPVSWHIAYNYASSGCSNNGSMDYSDKGYLRYKGYHLVDILLDCDTGTMSIKLIAPKDKIVPRAEHICYKMPSKKNNYKLNFNPDDLDGTDKGFKGYVPHFNISGEGTTMRIAKIPIECYGNPGVVDIFEQE